MTDLFTMLFMIAARDLEKRMVRFSTEYFRYLNVNRILNAVKKI